MDPERQQQLEEAVGFAEQRADALDEALRDTAERLAAALRRIEALEARLSTLETGSNAPEHEDPPPPHSGRLPGGR
ncbi:MAG: SlyX family protein [Planctomycetota bacterium]